MLIRSSYYWLVFIQDSEYILYIFHIKLGYYHDLTKQQVVLVDSKQQVKIHVHTSHWVVIWCHVQTWTN